MVAEISIRGAEKFKVVATALRAAGDRDLQRELYAGLNRTIRPLRDDVKVSTDQFMPGRYAAELSRDLSIRTRRRTGGRNPAIYLVGTAKRRDIASLNRGRLRHPLFGNRRFWYNTRIRLGWWTLPLLRGSPEVRRELVQVLDDLAVKIAKRVR